MRRILHFVVVAFLGAAVLPVVAQAGPAGLSGPGVPAVPGVSGAEPGLAELAAGVPAQAAPGELLDLLLTLDRPASPALTGSLAALGSWSWTAQHIPVAAIGLPAVNLDALRRLDGVRAVFPARPLHYYSDRPVSATATADPGPSPVPVPVPGVAPHDGFGAALPIPNLGVDGKGVTVAIVDSGIDGTHPDLAPALKANVKMSPLGPDGPLTPVEGLPDTDTSSGHGTHVAGDVAGRGTASGGKYQGSAPGASLVGLGAGEGLTVHPRAVLQAYEWIVAHHQQYGIRVVNNSFGGSFEPFNPMEPINQATKTAADAGMVVVFAQGNDGDEMTMNSNATAPWVIAVAAGTQKGGITDFTSGGLEADVVDPTFSADDVTGDPRQPLRMGMYHPSVVALGENVVGTRAAGTIVPVLGARHDVALPAGDQARYTIMSGTSMASPEACGVAALVLEADPALRPGDVKRVLQITARAIPGVPFFRQGYGYLDPAAGVGLARELAGRPAADVNRILDERQAARDAGILAAMVHPLRTTAWAKVKPDADGTATHKITVEQGTGRLKVVNAGFSAPFVPDPLHSIIVRDAAGKEIAHSNPHLPGGSGTNILDIDLTKLSDVSWGTWTVEVSEGGVLPVGFFGADEATVVATFLRPQAPDPVATLLPSTLPTLPPK
ncbi:MAG TPA: S8 family serine peptidase [Acidimicrobiia bacterium]|nr:S8 family serine peptidase [Acidimicrobiia bacterium]